MFFVDDRSLTKSIKSIDNSIGIEEGKLLNNPKSDKSILELLRQVFRLATEKDKDDLIRLYPKSPFLILPCPLVKDDALKMVEILTKHDIIYTLHYIKPSLARLLQ